MSSGKGDSPCPVSPEVERSPVRLLLWAPSVLNKWEIDQLSNHIYHLRTFNT